MSPWRKANNRKVKKINGDVPMETDKPRKVRIELVSKSPKDC